MTRLILAATMAAVGLAGCSTPGGELDGPPRQCFFASQASSFTAPSENRVYVRVGVNEVYQLDMLGPCRDIDWSHRIGIAPRGGGSNICAGFDADLIVPQAGAAPSRCPVRAVRRLSPAEVEALPPRDRP